MSLTKYNVEIDTEADKIEKPASQWRNWYLQLVDYHYVQGFRPAGMKKPGRFVWPSKDTAETAAIRSLSNPKQELGRAKYLGAFPEGQDAP